MKSLLIKKICAVLCCVVMTFCFFSNTAYALAIPTFSLYIDGVAADITDVHLETGDSYLFEIIVTGNYSENYTYDWSILPYGSRDIETEKVAGTDGRQVYVTPQIEGVKEVSLRYEVFTSAGASLGTNDILISITDTVVSTSMVKNAISTGAYEVAITSSNYKVEMAAFKAIYDSEKTFWFTNTTNNVSIIFDGLNLPDVDVEDYQETISLDSKFTADRVIRQSISQIGRNLGYSIFDFNEQYKVITISDNVFPDTATVLADFGSEYGDLAYDSQLYVFKYDTQTKKLQPDFKLIAGVTGRSSNDIEISIEEGGCYILTPYDLLSTTASSMVQAVSSSTSSAASSSSKIESSSSNSAISTHNSSSSNNAFEPIPYTGNYSYELYLSVFLLLVTLLGIKYSRKSINK